MGRQLGDTGARKAGVLSPLEGRAALPSRPPPCTLLPLLLLLPLPLPGSTASGSGGGGGGGGEVLDLSGGGALEAALEASTG
eukprot:SAG22_NODE_9203_length_603_cov_1.847222_1_plen_81_part_01